MGSLPSTISIVRYISLLSIRSLYLLSIYLSPISIHIFRNHMNSCTNSFTSSVPCRRPKYPTTAARSVISTPNAYNRCCHACRAASVPPPWTIIATMEIMTPRYAHRPLCFHRWHMVWGSPHWKHPENAAYLICRRTSKNHGFAPVSLPWGH